MSSSPDDPTRIDRSSSPDIAPRRMFADGTSWTVREVPAPSFDRRGGTHLIFESAEIMRRVRVFPRDWRRLSDEALYALSLDLHQRDRDAPAP